MCARSREGGCGGVMLRVPGVSGGARGVPGGAGMRKGSSASGFCISPSKQARWQRRALPAGPATSARQLQHGLGPCLQHKFLAIVAAGRGGKKIKQIKKNVDVTRAEPRAATHERAGPDRAVFCWEAAASPMLCPQEPSLPQPAPSTAQHRSGKGRTPPGSQPSASPAPQRRRRLWA